MSIIQFIESGGIANLTTIAATFQEKLTSMLASLPAEVLAPATLETNLTGLVAGNSGDGGLAKLGGIPALRTLFQYGRNAPAIIEKTAKRIQTLSNREALTALVRRTAMVEASRLIKDIQPDTYDDAIVLRDEMAEVLEGEAAISSDDAVYTTLMDLRAGVVADLTTRAADLSRLETITPIEGTNSLVMAYELYGDATREREIAERNGLAMPGFIPVKAIQVLNA